jgi:hypothetical protein
MPAQRRRGTHLALESYMRVHANVRRLGGERRPANSVQSWHACCARRGRARPGTKRVVLAPGSLTKSHQGLDGTAAYAVVPRCDALHAARHCSEQLAGRVAGLNRSRQGRLRRGT